MDALTIAVLEFVKDDRKEGMAKFMKASECLAITRSIVLNQENAQETTGVGGLMIGMKQLQAIGDSICADND